VRERSGGEVRGRALIRLFDELPHRGNGVAADEWLQNPEGEVVLYRGHEIQLARSDGMAGEQIYVVEDEATVDVVRSEGGQATTCVGGLSHWRSTYAHALRDLDVVIVSEASDVTDVASSLVGIARSVRVLRLAPSETVRARTCAIRGSAPSPAR